MMLVKAPKARSCCSACGKMAALFRAPLELNDGVRAAIAKRLGTEAAIRARIRDMRAGGQLLDYRG